MGDLKTAIAVSNQISCNSSLTPRTRSPQSTEGSMPQERKGCLPVRDVDILINN